MSEMLELEKNVNINALVEAGLKNLKEIRSPESGKTCFNCSREKIEEMGIPFIVGVLSPRPLCRGRHCHIHQSIPGRHPWRRATVQ